MSDSGIGIVHTFVGSVGDVNYATRMQFMFVERYHGGSKKRKTFSTYAVQLFYEVVEVGALQHELSVLREAAAEFNEHLVQNLICHLFLSFSLE